ncbi:MAG TPA: hypothetical protein VM432_04530 [Bdellovibrionales bacterium]|nr:hypothetical protein [Bdellovibrionales bacterium]
MKQAQTISKLTLIVLTLALTACGKMEFNQSPLEQIIKNPPFFKSTQGVEVVSGSTMSKRTVLNGYYVDASVGAPRDQLDSRTPNGYQVFHGVKGAIVSDSQ